MKMKNMPVSFMWTKVVLNSNHAIPLNPNIYGTYIVASLATMFTNPICIARERECIVDNAKVMLQYPPWTHLIYLRIT